MAFVCLAEGRKTCTSAAKKLFFFYRERVEGASACGQFCNRRQARPDLMMATHEIARDHFDYESGDASIVALKERPSALS